MSINESLTPKHWNYFLAIEDDVDQLSRYLELSQPNFSAFSLELARILFAAAAEIDVVAKQLCKKIDDSSKAKNISSYRDEITRHYPQISATQIYLPKFGLNLTPWEQWSEKNNPLWWTAYNNVKHQRHTHFAEANLKNALNATAALFALLLFFYRFEAENAALNPDPRLFRVGQPFQVGHTFYPPQRFIYLLPPS